MKFLKFSRTFWIANAMELFERWAWYGLFLVLAIYLTDPVESGALGFTQSQKGWLMGLVGGIPYLLAFFTGAIADKVGYKKVLFISYALLSVAYYFMGQFTSYPSIFIMFTFVATGAALFKPIIAATVAKTTNDKTRSIGFGVFYMMVNIGSLVGPFFASKLRELDWNYVFLMSSGVILLNFLLLLMYHEPEREPDKRPLKESLIMIFKNVAGILSDKKFLVFLLIVVGFWTMYLQLFLTLGVFISQWVDTSILYETLNNISPALAQTFGTDEGTVNPEMILNIDAGFIVLFQLIISTVVMKMRPLHSMIIGFFISSIGIGLTVMTQNPLFIIVSIFIFSIGEMSGSPKISEYIGKIAPREKVAGYMGCSHLPYFGGSVLAGIISGDVYTLLSDKSYLLRQELASKGFSLPEISSSYTQSAFYEKASELLSLSQSEITTHLWETYSPWKIGFLFTAIGIFTAIMLWLYDKYIIKN